ncbi:MAG: DUF1588 domain-containing protein [Bdellovibrionales bacterium]
MKTTPALVLVILALSLMGCGKMRGSTASQGRQTTAADDFFSVTNPDLYKLSRKYFPSDDSAPSGKRIFRLTRTQLDQAAGSLLPGYVEASVSTVVARDPLQTNYEYASNIGVNSSNFAPLSEWTSAIVERVRLNPKGVIDCTGQGDSISCLESQARSLLIKAFRGDLDEATAKKFLDYFTSNYRTIGAAEATAELVDLTLSSPRFLFRDETGAGPGGRLNSAELLQSLSFALTDSPPEKLQLSSAASANLVQTDEQLKNTAEEILARPETRKKLSRFFTAWLEVKEPEEFTISMTDFPSFNPSGVVAENQRFLDLHLQKPEPKLKDLTKATEEFNGTQLVNLDLSQKMGIFSQDAVIASHSGPTDTRLVKRGVFWVRKVMCRELSPPPQGVDTSLPPAGAMTERQRVESATNQSRCLGCHAIINPFGFFQENWDAIGRWRTTDNGLPVDARISTNILDEGPVNVSNPVEALQKFTDSAMFKQCFVRQLFRYYMGRDETPSDHATLREMFLYFSDNDNQDILTLLRILANSKRMTDRG